MNIEIGYRIGYLTVIKVKKCGKGYTCICQCDCGNIVKIKSSFLKVDGNRRPNKSCGCKKTKQNGNTMKYRRLYNIWKAMIARCNDPRHSSYERYGALGTKVCKEWENSFDLFLNWALDNGYKEDLTIDRIDNNKGYEPSNCRWATYLEQETHRKIFKNNKTGYTGVDYMSKLGKYRSTIMRKGKRYVLGYYSELEKARKDRELAEEYYKSNKTLEGVENILSYKPKRK